MLCATRKVANGISVTSSLHPARTTLKAKTAGPSFSPSISTSAGRPLVFPQVPNKNPRRAIQVTRASSSVTGSASDVQKMSLFTKVPGDELHVSKPTWWLESRFHFSFAGYWGKNNFGVLRVLNDDLVQPQSGFDTHGHRDMEIYSYVLDGALTHRDSMGNAETLGRGCVQYMSAGTGVTHSEHNRGGDLLRFLQVWIMPNRRSLPPNYGSRLYSLADRQNKLQHVIRGVDEDETNDTGEGVIPIHQDVNVYVSECEPRKSIPLSLKRSRQAYIVCAEGGMEVACGGVKETLKARDALEVRTQGMDADISFTSNEGTGAHFMVIEMASSS